MYNQISTLAAIETPQAHPWHDNPPQPHVEPNGEVIHTVDSLTYFCLKMDAEKAAQQKDTTWCVSPLITKLFHEGEVVELELREGRYAANESRVSSGPQRSGLARTKAVKSSGVSTKSRPHSYKGHSEEEQIRRAIWYFLHERLAFRIYNDSGISGEFPHEDETLVKALLKKKADRYKRIFEKVLLDEVSLRRRTPEQVASMRAYLKSRVDYIMRGALTDEELYRPSETLGEEMSKLQRRFKSRPKTFFRPAFSQMWADISENRVHLVTACDRSRLCRDADLELAFLRLCERFEVRVKGLVESLDNMDVSDPLRKGMTYLLGTYYENQLEDTATRSFRGHIQRAESGNPGNRLPWWLKRDSEGKIVLVPEHGAKIKEMVDLYLSGYGYQAIAHKFARDDYAPDGRPMTYRKVRATLCDTDKLAGVWNLFGLQLKTLPPVIEDPEILSAIRRDNLARQEKHQRITFRTGLRNHTYTGVLRCYCGHFMKWGYHPAYGSHDLLSFYACAKPNRGLDRVKHASVGERHLSGFFDELFTDNLAVLSGQVSKALAGTNHGERMRRREMLEREIEAAVKEYEAKAEVIRAETRPHALSMGLREGTPRYRVAVEGAVDERLGAEMDEITALRDALGGFGIRKDREHVANRLEEALGSLAHWKDLNALQRNRLIRSLFDKIVIYSKDVGRRAELYLIGVEEPLPPLWFRHVHGNDWRIPSVAEWLDDMTINGRPSHDTIYGWFRVGKMKRFYTFLMETGKMEDPQYADLVKIMQSDPKLRYLRNSKDSMVKKLRDHSAGDEVVAQVDLLWEEYMDREYAAHCAKKAKAHSSASPTISVV